MATLEIVTHCWCPPGVDQYARMLAYQAGSLYHWPPAASLNVTLTIFFANKDTATTRTITRLGGVRFPSNVTIAYWPLDESQLFRRAIGRNLRALETKADILWMTDIDYLFGEHCLDDIARQVDASSGLCIPGMIQIHKDHWTGDEELRRTAGQILPLADLTQFVPRKQKIAIGGVQIVGGDLARRIGYLQGTRWVESVDPALGFRSCKCDHAWRRHNNLKAERLAIRNVYRMRHTTDGRDYTLDGSKVGKAVW